MVWKMTKKAYVERGWINGRPQYERVLDESNDVLFSAEEMTLKDIIVKIEEGFKKDLINKEKSDKGWTLTLEEKGGYKCTKCKRVFRFQDIASSEERTGEQEITREEYSKMGREKSDVIFRCPECSGRCFKKIRPEGQVRKIKAR